MAANKTTPNTNKNIALSTAGVLIMSVVLLFYVVVGEESFGILARSVVFAAFAMMGGIFLKNIVQNEDRKDELGALNKELEKANTILKEKVNERLAEIENSRVHLETIIENLASGLVEYDNGGAVRRINRAAEEMLSTSRKDVMGIIPKDDSSARISLITYPRLAKNVLEIDPELYGIEALGAEIHEITIPGETEDVLQVTSVPLVVADEKNGTLKIIRDITKEKTVSRSKSGFITTAAHQLRTPLSVIKWAVNLLLEGDKGALKPEQIPELEKTNIANEKMIVLVNNLLDVARIEEGRYGFKFKEGDITPIIEMIVSRVLPKAEKKSISLSWTNPFPPISKIFFDEEKIMLALSNIIGNAVAFTKEKGTVNIFAENDSDYVKITVEDSGVGIPPEAQVHLFEKFFRAANAFQIRPDGSGLGLFVAHNIVKRHGGKIKIISPILGDLGTRVEVYLPKDKEKIPRLEEGEFAP
ncbi:MAG TPA: PAS domain-containing sensor histidine kinase [Candidatus Paceibacterota bacterium]|nr:PAS domain-containing sensor histidine kinase [Candidatus Paceibacterota bacterium]